MTELQNGYITTPDVNTEMPPSPNEAPAQAVIPGPEWDHGAFMRQVYLDHSGRLQTSRQSSFEQYDKAILTLSSAALTMSLGFIQGVLCKQEHGIQMLGPIQWSWYLFLFVIAGTVFSLWLAPKAIDHELEKCLDYFFHGKEEARTRKVRRKTRPSAASTSPMAGILISMRAHPILRCSKEFSQTPSIQSVCLILSMATARPRRWNEKR